MIVNTTELRANLSEYLAKAEFEDITITKNGIEIARLVSPKKAKKKALDDIVGIIPPLSDDEIKSVRRERFDKK